MIQLTMTGTKGLIDKLDNIEKNGLINMNALLSAGEVMKRAVYSEVPVNTGVSSTQIEVFEKINGKKLKAVKVGFDSSRTDWNNWKGAYFNNFGWKPHGSSVRIETKHRRWFDRAYNKGLDGTRAKLLEGLSRGIDL